ncbi:hypothetical protein [Streptomyces sp. NPDC002187]|uniref:hypothetical protein n=1 Tax=Streptomyces sp. NPDC002187 TaxID=3364637 RepID=UPI00369749FD
MISPEKIPTFTGDLSELGREIIALRQAAKGIREHGSDVHTRFQHLGASYKAPEAGQLFATTQAVQEGSGRFADRLETVAGALETYAVEVVEIVKQLDMLRWQAAVFVESVKDHDGPLENWRKDEAKVAEHQGIWDGVNAAIAAFQQAEVTCADKITALVDGTQWQINDGSPKQQNPYGFSAEQLAQADSLPWGSPEHREILPFGVDYHLEQAGISLVDNAVGSVEGLIDLFSPGEEGGAAREGLVRVIVGAEGYLLDPRGDRKDLSPFMKKFMGDSKPYAKEFGKAFVGWDDWSTNPGKAAGTVIFNGLTLGAGPLGAASKAGSAAGKAGTASRIAGAAAKVGEVLDPIGAAARTVGVAARTLPRVADLTAGVRAATDAAAASDATHSVIQLRDGSQLLIKDGQFVPGNKGVPDTTPAPREPAAADRKPSGTDNPQVPNPVREPALVGAGAAHAGGNAGDAARIGDSSGNDLGDVGRVADNAPGANAATNVPGGAANNLPGGGVGNAMPTNSLDNLPTGGGRPDNAPATGNVGDNTVPGARTDAPGTGGGHDLPTGAADEGLPAHPETPSGGGLDDAAHGADDGTRAGNDDNPSVLDPDNVPHSERDIREPGGNLADDAARRAADPVRVGDQPLPPPGHGEKILGVLSEGRVKRDRNGLIALVDNRNAEHFLKDLSFQRAVVYREAKELGTFARKQVGACVGSVMDLRTGMIIEGINGKMDNVIPSERVHPTIAARFGALDPKPAPDHPLGHAEVKAVNELLWERRRRGLPDDESALAELRASVEFPYILHMKTGLPGRPAAFCANCNRMLHGVDSSHGRFAGHPATDENWIP